MNSENSTGSEVIHRCMSCGRKITSAESIATGRGGGCRAKIRRAARKADLSAWSESQIEEARLAIEDGAVVPTARPNVFQVVSSDGAEVHLTHPDGCNCANGLRTRPPRPCWHRCAVAIVMDAPVLAPVALPVSADIWAEIDRLNAAFMAIA
jgi:hypothetical protein